MGRQYSASSLGSYSSESDSSDDDTSDILAAAEVDAIFGSTAIIRAVTKVKEASRRSRKAGKRSRSNKRKRKKRKKKRSRSPSQKKKRSPSRKRKRRKKKRVRSRSLPRDWSREKRRHRSEGYSRHRSEGYSRHRSRSRSHSRSYSRSRSRGKTKSPKDSKGATGHGRFTKILTEEQALIENGIWNKRLRQPRGVEYKIGIDYFPDWRPRNVPIEVYKGPPGYWKLCHKCGKILAKTAFSKTQWRKIENVFKEKHHGRCQICLENALTVGERVRFRDNSRDSWQYGVVTQVNPIETLCVVKRDGDGLERQWKYVERCAFEESKAPPSPKLVSQYGTPLNPKTAAAPPVPIQVGSFQWMRQQFKIIDEAARVEQNIVPDPVLLLKDPGQYWQQVYIKKESDEPFTHEDLANILIRSTPQAEIHTKKFIRRMHNSYYCKVTERVVPAHFWDQHVVGPRKLRARQLLQEQDRKARCKTAPEALVELAKREAAREAARKEAAEKAAEERKAAADERKKAAEEERKKAAIENQKVDSQIWPPTVLPTATDVAV